MPQVDYDTFTKIVKEIRNRLINEGYETEELIRKMIEKELQDREITVYTDYGY